MTNVQLSITKSIRFCSFLYNQVAELRYMGKSGLDNSRVDEVQELIQKVRYKLRDFMEVEGIANESDRDL